MKYKLVVQEKALRTLFLWLTWAGIGVAIHFAMYLDPNLWEYIKQDKTKVTWITYGLFFLGLLMSFMLVMRTFTESTLAAKHGMIATEITLMEILINTIFRAVERFFESLYVIVMRNEQPDIEAVLVFELAFLI